MKNSLVLLAVVLSVAAFAGMMRIKTDVQTMDRERMKLVHERADLRETKRVLEAEWALLASPDRLQHLVAGWGYVPSTALDVVLMDPRQGEGTGVSATVAGIGPVSGAMVVSEAMVGAPVNVSGTADVSSMVVAVSDTDAVSETDLVPGMEND